MPDVTKQDALAVLAAYRAAHNLNEGDPYGPVLRDDEEAPEDDPSYIVMWEEGPDDWPFEEDPSPIPAHVWLEPINHYSVRILPSR